MNINQLEQELEEIKINKSFALLNSLAFINIFILSSIVLYQQSFPYANLVSFSFLFLSITMNEYRKHFFTQKLTAYWQKVISYSKNDVRVKRYLDQMYKEEAYFYIKRVNKNYQLKQNFVDIFTKK